MCCFVCLLRENTPKCAVSGTFLVHNVLFLVHSWYIMCCFSHVLCDKIPLFVEYYA